MQIVLSSAAPCVMNSWCFFFLFVLIVFIARQQEMMKPATKLCLGALLENAGSVGTGIRREIIGAIVNLSKKGAPAVLDFCMTWLSNHRIGSIPVVQRTCIL
ncbi:hypothetical protein DQ04_00661080 [Trypanosoma grayi]|uniref:hypothetical protein n=1 Tax=Trypanosoma grayi TaxID=71804 RepID=UPI0004F47BD4|nr:hypothetical protein DQ04_00661080 [Trypanosoma grayi]KEG14030.1 hypothetical protein DQ04_00661080 [Trypanosoma grayi]